MRAPTRSIGAGAPMIASSTRTTDGTMAVGGGGSEVKPAAAIGPEKWPTVAAPSMVK